MSDSDLTKDDITALAVLLADVRDDINDALSAFQQAATPDAPLTRHLEELVHRLTDPPAHRRRLGRWMAGLLCLAFVGGIAVGWYVRGPHDHGLKAQATLMGQVDALLLARYETLPPTLQKALQALYTRAGFQPLERRR